jgi:hypothetical protein
LEDDCFGSLFNNLDYQINEDDINFSGAKAAQIKVDDDMDSDAEDSNNGFCKYEYNTYWVWEEGTVL